VAFRKPPQPSDGDWWNTILQVAAVKTEQDAESADAIRVSIDCQQYFASDQTFSVKLLRDHYVNYYREAEALQANQLAGLAATETATA
jgi:hypothetical protein